MEEHWIEVSRGLTDSAEVILCDADLLFSSKIEAASAKRGLTTKVTLDLRELMEELERAKPRMVFLNLDAAEGELGALAKFGAICKIVGYYSHVNTRLAAEAHRVGIANVFSRGALVGKLDELLTEAASG